MSDRVRKIMALRDGATTPGERAAAEAALARVLREAVGTESAYDYSEDILAKVARREPIDYIDYVVIRRLRLPELIAATEGWSWNPTEDRYYPPKLQLEAACSTST